MGQANTSKTQKPEPRSKWEVKGSFVFTADGTLTVPITTTVYVSAEDAPDAARRAVEKMGAGASIKKVSQLYNDEGEDE